MNVTHSYQKIFKDIYDNNVWHNIGSELEQTESKSGGGSTLKQTKVIVRELPILFKKLDIGTILDASCGDFNWMKLINFDNIKYIGIDIVPGVIEENIVKYQKGNI